MDTDVRKCHVTSTHITRHVSSNHFQEHQTLYSIIGLGLNKLLNRVLIPLVWKEGEEKG